MRCEARASHEEDTVEMGPRATLAGPPFPVQMSGSAIRARAPFNESGRRRREFKPFLSELSSSCQNRCSGPWGVITAASEGAKIQPQKSTSTFGFSRLSNFRIFPNTKSFGRCGSNPSIAFSCQRPKADVAHAGRVGTPHTAGLIGASRCSSVGGGGSASAY